MGLGDSVQQKRNIIIMATSTLCSSTSESTKNYITTITTSGVVYYLSRRLANGEGIVTLDVTLCVRTYYVRRISLGGEGNAL